jgi:hypothetical protein
MEVLCGCVTSDPQVRPSKSTNEIFLYLLSFPA